jgi:hypothetical protein
MVYYWMAYKTTWIRTAGRMPVAICCIYSGGQEYRSNIMQIIITECAGIIQPMLNIAD